MPYTPILGAQIRFYSVLDGSGLGSAYSGSLWVDLVYSGSGPEYSGSDPEYSGSDPDYSGSDPEHSGWDPEYSGRVVSSVWPMNTLYTDSWGTDTFLQRSWSFWVGFRLLWIALVRSGLLWVWVHSGTPIPCMLWVCGAPEPLGPWGVHVSKVRKVHLSPAEMSKVNVQKSEEMKLR